MRSISDIRGEEARILAVGSYTAGYQAILDFDYLSGKPHPSIQAIVSGGKSSEKFMWGSGEVLVPCYPTIAAAHEAGVVADWLLNITSARKAYGVTREFFAAYPDAYGAHLFAEDIPEIQALKLSEEYTLAGKTIVGPAGVGLLVPGALKLGVVGGVDHRQIASSRLSQAGSVAVLSASGGMINELITMVAATEHLISFALCFGGDRFPCVTPREALEAAQADPATKTVVYYGELGGEDEYEIVDMISAGQLTKPVVAYVAGIIGEKFEAPIQFGHAKALAGSRGETASAKRQALTDAGVKVAGSIGELRDLISNIQKDEVHIVDGEQLERNRTQFTSTISQESADGYEFVGRSMQDWASGGSIAEIITTGLLGRTPKSELTTELVNTIFLLSVDHGPQVSGAVNTMITARAGKGLVDSLAAGLLTIGPRFGGAVSGAARGWFDAVRSGVSAEDFVASGGRIAGIGHKKYRHDMPDPRTAVLAEFVGKISSHPHYDYAKSVEAITLEKKGNLILNVDGHIAALMLDVLAGEESLSDSDIDKLIDADFFNALFVLPRMVGFAAHYLDQKRLDEGLFRLPDDDIYLV